MPELPRRRGEFLRRLFEILELHPDGMQARDAIREVAATMPLTDYERGEYESGVLRVDKIIRFSTIGPVKAGWMIKQKGRWMITEEGKSAYRTYQNPEEFYKRASKLYYEWKATQTPEEPEAEEGEDLADESAALTFEQA